MMLKRRDIVEIVPDASMSRFVCGDRSQWRICRDTMANGDMPSTWMVERLTFDSCQCDTLDIDHLEEVDEHHNG